MIAEAHSGPRNDSNVKNPLPPGRGEGASFERGKEKGKFFLSFFSLMNTRSAVYEKTKAINFLLCLDTKKQNHPTTEFTKNIASRLKSFNSAPAPNDFYALILYFLNANSVMSGEEKQNIDFSHFSLCGLCTMWI